MLDWMFQFLFTTSIFCCDISMNYVVLAIPQKYSNLYPKKPFSPHLKFQLSHPIWKIYILFFTFLFPFLISHFTPYKTPSNVNSHTYDWEIEICITKKKKWHVLSPTTACNDRQAELNRVSLLIIHSILPVSVLYLWFLFYIDCGWCSHFYLLPFLLSLTTEGCFDFDHLRIDYSDKFRWTFWIVCLSQNENERSHWKWH